MFHPPNKQAGHTPVRHNRRHIQRSSTATPNKCKGRSAIIQADGAGLYGRYPPIDGTGITDMPVKNLLSAAMQ